jgi:hypothetical protein
VAARKAALSRLVSTGSAATGAADALASGIKAFNSAISLGVNTDLMSPGVSGSMASLSSSCTRSGGRITLAGCKAAWATSPLVPSGSRGSPPHEALINEPPRLSSQRREARGERREARGSWVHLFQRYRPTRGGVQRVLGILLALGDAQAAQLADCHDLDTLERWLDLAITASTSTDVFG